MLWQSLTPPPQSGSGPGAGQVAPAAPPPGIAPPRGGGIELPTVPPDKAA